MPRWNNEEYAAYLARRQAGYKPPSAEPEPPVQNESMAAQSGKAKDAKRVSVSVTSFRCRLVDPDNLCPKYFVDCLRYAGLIQDDRAQDIELTVRQEKVAAKAAERTEIELIRL